MTRYSYQVPTGEFVSTEPGPGDRYSLRVDPGDQREWRLDPIEHGLAGLLQVEVVAVRADGVVLERAVPTRGGFSGRRPPGAGWVWSGTGSYWAHNAIGDWFRDRRFDVPRMAEDASAKLMRELRSAQQRRDQREARQSRIEDELRARNPQPLPPIPDWWAGPRPRTRRTRSTEPPGEDAAGNEPTLGAGGGGPDNAAASGNADRPGRADSAAADIPDPSRGCTDAHDDGVNGTDAAAGAINFRPISGDVRNLPHALEPLIDRKSWMLWKFEARNGKRTKVPYQPNGRPAKSNDPTTWTTYADVISKVDAYDGVGIVVADFAAFDLDNCRNPETGEIDAWAKELLEKVGSYAEVTPSQKGMRIIGLGSGERVQRKLAVPGSDGGSLEIYRRTERYITVTGAPVPGFDRPLIDIDACIDAELARLGAAKNSRKRSNGRANGHAAGVANDSRDLPPTLKSLLSVSGPGGFPSRSELLFAFLTGAIRAGIEEQVIITACVDLAYEGCGIYDHCADKGGRPYVARQIAQAQTAIVCPEVEELNKQYAVVQVGDKIAIMKTTPEDKFEKLLGVGPFKDWFANRWVVRDGKRLPLATYWLQHPQRRQYEGLEFAPGKSRPGYFNLWRGFAVQPRQGDCSKFLAHLKDNVCAGDEEIFHWVVGWFASIFQRPDKKFGTSLALRGKQGAGKTIVGRMIGSLLGDHYALVSDPRYITGRFNSHMNACLLLHADEAFWAGDRAAEGRLKDLVTGDLHFVEFKGKEPVRLQNHIRLFITGNHDWIVPAGHDERRFAVLDVGDDHMQDTPYFAAIDEEMDNGGREALLHYLLTFDLSGVDLRAIPRTAALLQQKISSLNSLEAWWLDVLQRGELPWGCQEERHCPANRLFDGYIKSARSAGVRRRSIETQVGHFLNTYVPGLVRTKAAYEEWRPVTRTTGSGRGKVYVFPPLSRCRDAFQEALGQEIRWPDGDTDWTRETAPYDDGEIPF